MYASPFPVSTELPTDFVPFPSDEAEKSIPDYFVEIASRIPTKLAVSDFEKSPITPRCNYKSAES